MRILVASVVLLTSAFLMSAQGDDREWITVSGTIESVVKGGAPFVQIAEAEGPWRTTNASFSVERPLPRSWIKISAPYHYPATVEFYQRGNKNINVDVKLATILKPGRVDQVKIIGDYNEWDFGSAQEMRRISKDQYEYRLPVIDGKVRYQVILDQVNGAEIRSTNGTMHDTLLVDGGGDLVSVVYSDEDSLTIRLDVAKFPRSDEPFSYKIDDDYMQLVSEEIDRDRAFMDAFNGSYLTAFYAKDTATRLMLIDSMHRIAKRQYEALKTLEDGELRDVHLHKMLDCWSNASRNGLGYMQEWETEAATYVANTFPIEGPHWKFGVYRVASLATAWNSPEARAYILRSASEAKTSREHSNSIVGAMYNIARADSSAKEIGLLMEILQDRYPASPALERARRQFGTDRNILPGKPLPAFSFASLNADDEWVTQDVVNNKYLLIDIWATWCGPCVEEMPRLHKVYKRFKDSGKFQMLSISVDRKAESVATFREKRYEMPWLAAHSPPADGGDAGTIFEVIGVPKVILVDPNGVILRVNDGLRGEELEKTLSSYLD